MSNLVRRVLPPVGFLCVLALTAADEPAKPRGTVTREFDVQGFHVRVDLAPQVIGVDVPEDRGYSRSDHAGREEAALSPTLAATGGFVSASVLAQKAKQFDDGLYAAVELAAQNGAGKYAGKAGLAGEPGARDGGVAGKALGQRRDHFAGCVPAGRRARRRARGNGGGNRFGHQRFRRRHAAVETDRVLHVVGFALIDLSPGSHAAKRAEGGRRDRGSGPGDPFRPIGPRDL